MVKVARTFRSLLALLVLAGFGSGLAWTTIVWNTDGFDPYDDDEGYIDFDRDGGEFTVLLVTEEGSIPATMEGDALPLNDDWQDDPNDRAAARAARDRLRHPNALALYGGLPIDVGPTHITFEVEGPPADVDAAMMARIGALGLLAEEGERGRVFRTYRLSDGDDAWTMTVSHVGGETLVDLRALR